ncbi:MAG: hypothetical protein PHE27_05935 [Alphaproteobacteria bacterium]|nr:hypothetical protein [Alphaproteobacteria bacterium]
MNIAGLTISRQKAKDKKECLEDEIETILQRFDSEANGDAQANATTALLPSGHFGALKVVKGQKYNTHELIENYREPLVQTIEALYADAFSGNKPSRAELEENAEYIIREEFRDACIDVSVTRECSSIGGVVFSLGAIALLPIAGFSASAGILASASGVAASYAYHKWAKKQDLKIDRFTQLERIAAKNDQNTASFEGDKGVYKRAVRNIKKMTKGKKKIPYPY